jgi:hypothetical protein
MLNVNNSSEFAKSGHTVVEQRRATPFLWCVPNYHRNLRSRTSRLAQVLQIFLGKEHLHPRQGNLLQRNNFLRSTKPLFTSQNRAETSWKKLALFPNWRVLYLAFYGNYPSRFRRVREIPEFGEWIRPRGTWRWRRGTRRSPSAGRARSTRWSSCNRTWSQISDYFFPTENLFSAKFRQIDEHFYENVLPTTEVDNWNQWCDFRKKFAEQKSH